MFIKIAIAATAIVAAGTTAFVVHGRSEPPKPAPAQIVVTPTKNEMPTPTVQHTAAARPQMAVESEPDDGLPPGAIRAPRPDTEASIPKQTIERLGLERGPARGPANAPIVITVFQDMRCKYCVQSLASLDQLMEEYPGKLRIVMKQLPVHESAKLAAEAALAADAQGKFWELHDLMMANQDDLSRDAILALAPQAGVDVAKLRSALDNHTFQDGVAADMKVAKELEIQATPAFVINGRKIIGAVDVTFFRNAIDSALAD